MDDLNEVRKVSEAAYRFLSRINPKDAHMPGVCDGTPEKVQKAVTKVPCS